MKKYFSIVLALSCLLIGCKDKSGLSGLLDDYDARMEALEQKCGELNTNIESLKTIIDAVDHNDNVTSLVPIVQNGDTIGYTVTFGNEKPVTIYCDGGNNKNDSTATSPNIGVEQGENGYVWTLDGKPIVDSLGHVINTTPLLKIEDGYWYVSYDGGATWTKLDKATGEGGDSGIFQGVTTDGSNVVFTLADGTVLTVPQSNSASSGVENGHEYVDLGLSVKWATCDVGATKPEESGNLYAWGETEPKDSYSWGNYKYGDSEKTMTKYCAYSSWGTVDNKSVLDSIDDVASVKWKGTWRMPTYQEINELMTKCTWTWYNHNGLVGALIYGPNGNTIFLPQDTADNIAYWSSTVYQGYIDQYSPANAYGFRYYLDTQKIDVLELFSYSRRYQGWHVRPVCDK